GRSIIDYLLMPPPTVLDQLRSGYSDGSWTGTGINSSAAAADAARRTAVGFALSSDLFGPGGGVFGGETVDGTAVLLSYTLYGDANLDRAVNLADFAVVGSNFNNPSVWSRGDFNYNGLTELGDFALLAANFNQSIPGDLPRSAVPEPAVAFAAAILWLCQCRRRNVGASCSPGEHATPTN
ncbi:MAG: hypothetical protein NZ561_03760, partial [Phycisphaerae bacterium]|nr:hypothetical protein [Phycisphaerae bacterium]